jgi:hypothetical protein
VTGVVVVLFAAAALVVGVVLALLHANRDDAPQQDAPEPCTDFVFCGRSYCYTHFEPWPCTGNKR